MNFGFPARCSKVFFGINFWYGRQVSIAFGINRLSHLGKKNEVKDRKKIPIQKRFPPSNSKTPRNKPLSFSRLLEVLKKANGVKELKVG